MENSLMKKYLKYLDQPASGDAGGALGCALFTHYQLMENNRIPSPHDSMEGSFLGPKFENNEIRSFLDKNQIPNHFLLVRKGIT